MLLLFLLNSVAPFPVLPTCQPVSYLTGWHVGELRTIGFLEDCTGACLHKLKTTLCLHERVCIGKYLHKQAQPQYHKASISCQTANCTLSNLWEFLAGHIRRNATSVHLKCFSWDVNSCINFENHSRNIISVQFLLLCVKYFWMELDCPAGQQTAAHSCGFIDVKFDLIKYQHRTIEDKRLKWKLCA